MIYIKFCFHLPFVKLSSYLKYERDKMKTKYNNILNPDDLYNGPSDEELKRIEEELEKYSD